MTQEEYLKQANETGNERVSKLFKFLQENGYGLTQFDLGYLAGLASQQQPIATPQ